MLLSASARLDTLLARAVDRRRVEGPADATAVAAITGTTQRRWARLLGSRLEELAALGAP